MGWSRNSKHPIWGRRGRDDQLSSVSQRRLKTTYEWMKDINSKIEERRGEVSGRCWCWWRWWCKEVE